MTNDTSSERVITNDLGTYSLVDVALLLQKIWQFSRPLLRTLRFYFFAQYLSLHYVVV